MNIRDSFDRVGFTPEEKMDLTARLERAADLEENMTDATKRKIKRISGGMIFGVAAAAIMTVGALAAAGREHGISKTALVLVGDFLGEAYERSKLYDPAFSTGFREADQ